MLFSSERMPAPYGVNFARFAFTAGAALFQFFVNIFPPMENVSHFHYIVFYFEKQIIIVFLKIFLRFRKDYDFILFHNP